MYAHTHLFICACLRAGTVANVLSHIYIQTQAHTDTKTHRHRHTDTHAHTHTNTHTHTHTHTHTTTHTHTHTHTRTHARTHTHTHTHTHTQTHTHKPVLSREWFLCVTLMHFFPQSWTALGKHLLALTYTLNAVSCSVLRAWSGLRQLPAVLHHHPCTYPRHAVVVVVVFCCCRCCL